MWLPRACGDRPLRAAYEDERGSASPRMRGIGPRLGIFAVATVSPGSSSRLNCPQPMGMFCGPGRCRRPRAALDRSEMSAPETGEISPTAEPEIDIRSSSSSISSRYGLPYPSGSEAKREAGDLTGFRRCPRNCKQRASAEFATGAKALGRLAEAVTCEPGDLP